MRKIVLALLVLLLAVPAMATVEVRCAQVSTTKQVVVTYDVDDGNDFRAFGIKISVDNGQSISDIDVNDRDYYIFPGSIDINEAGDVNDWGSAIAAQDSNSFILEMGSLYAASDPDHNTAPPTSGQLCSFMVSNDCNVAIANDAARGGVVMEDLDFAGSVALIGCQVDWVPCFPEGHADFQEWLDVNEPSAWCGAKHCHGDATNSDEQFGRGNYVSVGITDFAILAVGYNRNDYSGDPAVDGNDPDSEPDTWIAADFTRAAEQFGRGNYVRVSIADFTILAEYYNVNTSLVPADCP
jgi:hypothetical protein